MDDVLEGVRQETRQSIQQQVKTETREVIAEETVIPSGTLSGHYVGTTFGDNEALTCDFSFTGTTSGAFTGTCTDGDGSRFAISGTFSGTNFSLTLTETFSSDGVCPQGTETASGSGTISGKGEPGTVITGTAGGTCGDISSDSFSLTKN